MRKLELQDIVGYLPYGLKSYNMYPNGEMYVSEVDLSNIMNFINIDTRGKIFLRPLSDLTKEIEVDGDKFVPIDKLYAMSDYSEYIESIKEDIYEMNTPVRWPYEIVKKLYSWHFDVENLIGDGLAIDINTLK